ncbi:MAG: hypothetical protein IJP53_01710 [Synergistaceae bacterium]|nr:hypothetical protein [Synergistaceae bacterium]
MPSNVIIFDSDYIAELTASMNMACDLVGEAVSSLKTASLHEGWKCKECTRISENLDDLNLRLGRLDKGVNETVSVLGGSVARFAELEAKYESQANSLSEELRANYGYSASVHGSSVPQGTGETAGIGAGVAGAGAKVPGAKTEPQPQRGSSSPSMNIGLRGLSGVINPNDMPGVPFQSGGSVNLPVTHIPDKPEAAAKGVKDTLEVADIAVTSVADSITNLLGGKVSVRVVGSDGSDVTVKSLVETYNAGKSIVENSAMIVSSPAMPHTEERLAMAAGLVSLAGSAVTGVGMLVKPSSANIQTDVQNMRKSARDLLQNLQDDSESNELRTVLGVISAAGASDTAGASTESLLSEVAGGSGDSFFAKIISLLMGKIDGNSSKTTSASATTSNAESSVQKFFGNFVADWA